MASANLEALDKFITEQWAGLDFTMPEMRRRQETHGHRQDQYWLVEQLDMKVYDVVRENVSELNSELFMPFKDPGDTNIIEGSVLEFHYDQPQMVAPEAPVPFITYSQRSFAERLYDYGLGIRWEFNQLGTKWGKYIYFECVSHLIAVIKNFLADMTIIAARNAGIKTATGLEQFYNPYEALLRQARFFGRGHAGDDGAVTGIGELKRFMNADPSIFLMNINYLYILENVGPRMNFQLGGEKAAVKFREDSRLGSINGIVIYAAPAMHNPSKYENVTSLDTETQVGEYWLIDNEKFIINYFDYGSDQHNLTSINDLLGVEIYSEIEDSDVLITFMELLHGSGRFPYISGTKNQLSDHGDGFISHQVSEPSNYIYSINQMIPFNVAPYIQTEKTHSGFHYYSSTYVMDNKQYYFYNDQYDIHIGGNIQSMIRLGTIRQDSNSFNTMNEPNQWMADLYNTDQHLFLLQKRLREEANDSGLKLSRTPNTVISYSRDCLLNHDEVITDLQNTLTASKNEVWFQEMLSTANIRNVTISTLLQDIIFHVYNVQLDQTLAQWQNNLFETIPSFYPVQFTRRYPMQPDGTDAAIGAANNTHNENQLFLCTDVNVITNNDIVTQLGHIDADIVAAAGWDVAAGIRVNGANAHNHKAIFPQLNGVDANAKKQSYVINQLYMQLEMLLLNIYISNKIKKYNLNKYTYLYRTYTEILNDLHTQINVPRERIIEEIYQLNVIICAAVIFILVQNYDTQLPLYAFGLNRVRNVVSEMFHVHRFEDNIKGFNDAKINETRVNTLLNLMSAAAEGGVPSVFSYFQEKINIQKKPFTITYNKPYVTKTIPPLAVGAAAADRAIAERTGYVKWFRDHAGEFIWNTVVRGYTEGDRRYYGGFRHVYDATDFTVLINNNIGLAAHPVRRDGMALPPARLPAGFVAAPVNSLRLFLQARLHMNASDDEAESIQRLLNNYVGFTEINSVEFSGFDDVNAAVALGDDFSNVHHLNAPGINNDPRFANGTVFMNALTTNINANYPAANDRYAQYLTYLRDPANYNNGFRDHTTVNEPLRDEFEEIDRIFRAEQLLALLNSSINIRNIEKLIKIFRLPVPINFLLLRPFWEFNTSGVILAEGGAKMGKTYVGHITSVVNEDRGVLTGATSTRFTANAVVEDKTKVWTESHFFFGKATNIGGNTKFFDLNTFNEFGDTQNNFHGRNVLSDGEERPSLIAILLKPGQKLKIQTDFIDFHGKVNPFDTTKNDRIFPIDMQLEYKMYLDALKDDVAPFKLFPLEANRVCWRGRQRRYNTTKKRFTTVDFGAGPLVNKAIPGFRARRNDFKVIQPPVYGNAID